MKNKKIITINDLALMIGKGFEGTTEQIKETIEQIGGLEKWAKVRFDILKKEIKGIRKQLTGVVYRNEFEELELRV